MKNNRLPILVSLGLVALAATGASLKYTPYTTNDAATIDARVAGMALSNANGALVIDSRRWTNWTGIYGNLVGATNITASTAIRPATINSNLFDVGTSNQLARAGLAVGLAPDLSATNLTVVGGTVSADLSSSSNYPASKLSGAMAFVPTNGVSTTQVTTNLFVGLKSPVPAVMFVGFGIGHPPSGFTNDFALANGVYWYDSSLQSYTNASGYGLAQDDDGGYVFGTSVAYSWVLTNATYCATNGDNIYFIICSTNSPKNSSGDRIPWIDQSLYWWDGFTNRWFAFPTAYPAP